MRTKRSRRAALLRTRGVFFSLLIVPCYNHQFDISLSDGKTLLYTYSPRILTLDIQTQATPGWHLFLRASVSSLIVFPLSPTFTSDGAALVCFSSATALNRLHVTSRRANPSVELSPQSRCALVCGAALSGETTAPIQAQEPLATLSGALKRGAAEEGEIIFVQMRADTNAKIGR